MSTESEGLGTKDLEANTELSHSALSRVESAAMPFQEREGMEGEHTQETGLRHHHVLEEGDKFESSFFRLDMSFSGSPESGHTLVTDFLECTEIAFSWICLPGREGRFFFRKTASQQDSVYHGREEG